LDKGAVGLFLKGQDVVSELTEATKYWKFEAQSTASLSHPDGRILQVKGLKRVRKV
jgi:16S rRNA (guanine527-N7)-methyltransferase